MRNALHRFSAIVLVTILLSISLGVQPANAGVPWEFVVDSYEDLNDTILNSVCSVGDSHDGPCTLRGAIAEGNAIIDTFDILITIPSGTYTLSIAPTGSNDITSGDLNFAGANSLHSITLVCPDPNPAVIDANLLDRVLQISTGAVVYLENIVVRGGLLDYTGSELSLKGAGILNSGTAYLTDVIVENNEGRCVDTGCVNFTWGGGIMNENTMLITDSMIRNNISVVASAIFNTGDGGLFIKNSTIYDNQATIGFTINNYANLHLRNVTMSGNIVAAGYVAGINNNSSLAIESSTFANIGRASSVYNASVGTVTIEDSIFQHSSGGNNCENEGSWNSTGYNIYSDASCPASGTGDLVNTDPLLGELDFWGGPTKTMPLGEGSPALDHRPDACWTFPESPTLPPEPLLEDQRHFPRLDSMCDTGAFEVMKIYLPLLYR